MCGRFAQPGFDELVAFYDAELGGGYANYGFRFNLAPTQNIGILRLVEGRRQLAEARWGFEASWTTKPLFNAKSEEVHLKKTFKQAFAIARCAVPAACYYEWRAGAGSDQGRGASKRPFRIRPLDGAPLVMLGLWQPRRGDELPPQCCTILTKAALPDLAEVHHRMPCVVRADDPWLDIWLDPDFEDTATLQQDLAQSDVEFELSELTPYINKAGNEGPDCWTMAVT